MTKAAALCLWLYCGIAFFDPSDMVLGVKLPLFAMAMILYLAARIRGKARALPRDLLAATVMVSLAIPTFYLTVFLVRHPGGDIRGGLALAKGLLALMLVLPSVSLGIDLKKPVLFFCGLMIVSVIGLQAYSAMDGELFRKISGFLTGHNMAMIGSRSFGELDLAMIFFVTTPLLVVTVPFFAGEVLNPGKSLSVRLLSLLFLILVLLASFFSASRAVFLVLLAECLACYLIAVRRRAWLLLGGLTLTAAFILIGSLALQRTGLFSTEEQSNSVKVAHYKSFREYIDQDPAVLLTGDGLGAVYLTRAPGINREVFQTELTYLDMIRYFGLAGMLLFMLLLAVPFFKTTFDPLNLIGFLAYLAVAGSNPLLFNSTGMLAVAYFWSRQYRDKTTVPRLEAQALKMPEGGL